MFHRNELALMAAHCGVFTQREGKVGSRHVEPRALANTNGFQGGADLLLSGLAILDAGEKNTALVAVTFPAATATSNKTATRKWAPMENIDKFEEKKLAHTDYHADTGLNGWDLYPCAIFKDTRTSGTRMQLLMERLAATRGRVEFNGDLHREHGYREGMWTTSNVLHYWSKLRVSMRNVACASSYISIPSTSFSSVQFSSTVSVLGCGVIYRISS